MLQFIGRQAQDGTLNRIDLHCFAIEKGHERGIEFGAMFLHAAQQVLEIIEVGDFHVLLVAELLDDVLHRVAADLPGVERLRGAAAGARTRGQVDAVGAAVLRHDPAPGANRARFALAGSIR